MNGRDRMRLEDARRLGQGSAHLDADPTYARVLMRKVSPYVSWAIVRLTPLSADAVTVLAILCGIAGGLLAAPGTLATNLAAVVLLQLAYVLDVADGEVARIRGTAGRRGTYLDLIGHVMQNRALYVGAALSLIAVTGGATWAVLAGLVTMGFATPFGLYARMQTIRRSDDAGHPDHGPRRTIVRPGSPVARAWLVWLYRRASFLWDYPASMNLFCVALLADAARSLAGHPDPLVVPVLFAVFGPSLALKQVAHALRLLRATDW